MTVLQRILVANDCLEHDGRLIVAALPALGRYWDGGVLEVERQVEKLLINTTLMWSRHYWWLVVHLNHTIPVDALHPHVVLDVLHLLVPLGWVLLQQPAEQVLQLGREVVLLVLRFVVDDALVDLVVVLVEMGRKPNDQLIQESTKAIDVGLSVVSLAE